MINYYDELGLDRNLSLEELNQQLIRLESVWKRRRTRVPEAATKKLALIVSAREVFRSASSRAEYDLSLGGHREQAQEEQPVTNWYKLALNAAAIKDWRETLNYIENGLFQEPTDTRLWWLKSQALREMGDMLGALGAARQRVRYAQNDPDAHADLGFVLKLTAAPPPAFEILPGRRPDMEEARDEYRRAVALGDERRATEVAQCCEFLGEWADMLTWSTRALEANKYDECANLYYAMAVAIDAEDKLSGGTTITNARQLAYVKSAIGTIKGIELVACDDNTRDLIQGYIDELQGLVAEAEQVAWRGFRYGQMSGYEYAARTLPQALVKTGIQ